MVGLLAELLQDSRLDKADIEHERGVILREKEEVEKIDEEVVFDHLHATAYQGSSLGLTILGTDDNIKSLNGQDLNTYIRQNYTPDRMVLVGSGDIDHDQLVKLGEKYFGNLVPSAGKPKSLPPVDFVGSELKIRDDTKSKAHMAVAVEGVGWTHPDHIPLLVAQTIAGSWDKSMGSGQHLGSKLAQAVAAGDLADSFTSFNTTYTDTSLFGLYMVASDRMKLIDLCETALYHWTSIAHSSTETDLVRAKNQLKSSLLFALDNSMQIADEIGRHVLCYGRRLSPLEISEMVDAVTLEDVRRVAGQYVYDVDPAVVAVGPIEAWPDYVVLRSKMSQFLH